MYLVYIHQTMDLERKGKITRSMEVKSEEPTGLGGFVWSTEHQVITCFIQMPGEEAEK